MGACSLGSTSSACVRWLAGCMGFVWEHADSFLHCVASPFHSFVTTSSVRVRKALLLQTCRCRTRVPPVPAAVCNLCRPCAAGHASPVTPRLVVGGTSSHSAEVGGPCIRGSAGWHSCDTARPATSYTRGPLAQPSMGLEAQCAQVDCYGVRDAVTVCPTWCPGTVVG